MTVAVGSRRAAARQSRFDARPAAATAAVLAALAVVAAIAGLSSVVTPLGPLAVAVGALLVLAVYARPVVGAVLVAAVAPAVAGLSRGVGLPGLKISEVLVILVVGVLLFRRPNRWRALTGVDVALGVFAGGTLALAAYHLARGDIGLGDQALVAVQPTFLLLGWWAASRGTSSRADVLTVVRWVLLVSVVPAALALAQYSQLFGVAEVLQGITGQAADQAAAAQALAAFESSGAVVDTALRVSGPFSIWHSLGGYLLLPTVIAALLLVRGDRSVLSRGWLLAVLAVDVSALVLTVTVTLFIWLPVAILVGAALAKVLRRALLLLVVLGAVAALAFGSALGDRLEQQTAASDDTAAVSSELPGGLQTLQYRFLVWQRDYLPVVGRAAALGLGTDSPPSVLFTSTENQYLTYLLRGGLVQVLVSLLALGALTVRALRHARNPRAPARTVVQGLVGVLAFMPVALMVWPYLSNAGLSYLLFGLAGSVLALEPAPRRARGPAPSAPPLQAASPVTTSGLVPAAR
ncbi:hypothetical protein [Blastococcus sp. SYSU D00695]